MEAPRSKQLSVWQRASPPLALKERHRIATRSTRIMSIKEYGPYSVLYELNPNSAYLCKSVTSFLR